MNKVGVKIEPWGTWYMFFFATISSKIKCKKYMCIIIFGVIILLTDVGKQEIDFFIIMY